MPAWETRLAEEKANAPKKVERARRFLIQNHGLLAHYQGGMPLGFLAIIAIHESGGDADATGDPSLGEYGYFQVATDTPAKYGLSSELRKTPEGNIFLGCLDYNVQAQRLAQRYPVILPASRDQWLMARLALAIGPGAVKGLMERAQPSFAGRVYRDVLRYVSGGGARAAGTQTADKVALRVHLVGLHWEMGQEVVPQGPGVPSKIPAPNGLAYTVPSDVRPKLTGHGDRLAMIAGGIALSLALGV